MTPPEKTRPRHALSPGIMLYLLKSAIQKETAFLVETGGGKPKKVIEAAEAIAADRIEALKKVWKKQKGVHPHIECIAALEVAWTLCESLHSDLAEDERKADGSLDAEIEKKKSKSLFLD